MLSVTNDEPARQEGRSILDEICREGARRMLAVALELEADLHIAALVAEVDELGHRLVTRNGHARPRTITTVAGAVEIQAPRVRDRRVDPETGEKKRFKSSIVPPWCRKSPKVVEMLPLRAAQDRWRPTNGPHLVALVRAGAPVGRGNPDSCREQGVRSIRRCCSCSRSSSARSPVVNFGAGLATQHSKLQPQHHNLQVLGAITSVQEDQQAGEQTDDQPE
jgi:hypothetical protein